jgi:hypothetical protein
MGSDLTPGITGIKINPNESRPMRTMMYASAFAPIGAESSLLNGGI